MERRRLSPAVPSGRSRGREWKGVLRLRDSKVPPGTWECYALNAITKKKTETLFWSKCEASLIFREKWKCCSSPCLWQPYKLQFSAFSTFCCCCYTTHYIERVGMGIWVCDPYLQICMYVCMCTGCHMPTGSTNICHRKAICLSWPESLNRLSVMTIESAPSCNAMHCIITVPQLTISGVDGSVQSRKNYGNRMRIPGTWWQRMAAIRMDQRTRK